MNGHIRGCMQSKAGSEYPPHPEKAARTLGLPLAWALLTGCQVSIVPLLNGCVQICTFNIINKDADAMGQQAV